MPKTVTDFECRSCGALSSVHLGRCPRCGEWDTLAAKVTSHASAVRSNRPRPRDGYAVEVVDLSEAAASDAPTFSSGIVEVDRVLGGGFVAGGVGLLGGEPGIGKSTLTLQIARHVVDSGRSVLYVAGEESLGQIARRAKRLGWTTGLSLTRETDAHAVAEAVQQGGHDLVVVDSIQTMGVGDDAVPGTLTQIRDSTAVLTGAAKASNTAMLLIGHVTKEGSIAGPKVVEHVVDATFTMESAAGMRILRSIKNRFGPAGEVGVFTMDDEGLHALPNPSDAFLAERPVGVPGSVVAAVMEGQRPLLLEVQALASKTPYSSPRRVVQGIDARRVDVVLAVLERRLGVPLDGLDVFVNVAGGLRITDPGADLAVAVAVWSAVHQTCVATDVAVVGEIGLAGELRGVSHVPARVREARRSGFRRVVGPPHDELGHDGIVDLATAVQRTKESV